MQCLDGGGRRERTVCGRPHCHTEEAGSESVEEAEFGCHTQSSEALGKSLTSQAPAALAGPREGEMTVAAGAVLCSLAVSLLLNDDDLGWSAKDRKVENVSSVDMFEATSAESCTPHHA